MESTLPSVGIHHVSRPSSAWTWIVGGWRMYLRAPVRIFLIAVLPILAEGMLQLLPVAGIVASKLVTPLVFAWVLAMLHAKFEDAQFAPRAMATACAGRRGPLVGVALLSLAVFALQLAVTWAIGGADQATALALGQVAALELTKPQLALIFASGTIPGVALMFVLPRILFDGRGILDAMVDNAKAVRIHWKALVVVWLVSAAAVASVLWFPLLLLLILPFSLCVGYASYRDVYGIGRQ